MGFQAATNLTQQIADHLASEVIEGRLVSNDRIQELRLARELGVSRGSVREALLILERSHLIEIIPRKGAVVRALRRREVNEFSDLLEMLSERSLHSLCRDGTDLSVMQARLQDMVEALRDDSLEGVQRARLAYHRAAVDACSERYLAATLSSLLYVGQRLSHMATAHDDFDLRDTVRFYQALQMALSARDQGRVSELVRAFSKRERHLALNCTAGASNSLAAHSV